MKTNNTDRGIQLFELGKYQKSIQYFKDALAENINDFEAKYYLAFSLLCIKEFKKSENLLLELLSKNTENEYVIFLLAKNKYFSKNIKEAEVFINQAIAINPNESDFFGIKAYIYTAKKEHKKAIRIAKEGLKIDPKNQLCLNALINETGKLKEDNTSDINNLLHLNPENSFAQANVGFSELRKHNYEKAKNHFVTALSLDPTLKLAKDGMVAYYKLKGNYLNYLFGIPLVINRISSKNPSNLIFGFFFFAFIFSQLYYYESFSFLCLPFTIFYLYLIFGSWLFEPFSNLKILFSKYGKHLLDQNQKKSGISFFILILFSLCLFVIFNISKNYAYLVSSFSSICISVFISKGLLSEIKKNKIFSYSFSLLHLLIAILGFFFTNQSLWLGIIIFVTFVIYTRNLNDIK